jgi:histidyl-tRNA synthetase
METVKGFTDFLGEEAKKREEIRKIIVETFEMFGFEPAETPIIEQEEFVKGNNQQDEAVSDIFKLQDKGKRNLALRYEFTFQLKRIANNQKLPYKRYQIGPVFRDEPVSSNRFRQFTQCDIDIIGSSFKEEAEILSLSSELFKKLGIKAEIEFNNRKLLNEILNSEKINEKDWPGVLREIDKLGKIPESEIIKELKKYKAEKILEIIKKPEKYFEKFSSFKEIEELKKEGNLYRLKIKFSPTLMRGLSYYNGSIFEIKTKEMKETIAAGGSYLINNIQSTGISFGLERLSLLAKIKGKETDFLLISIGQDKETISLSEELRKNKKSCTLMFGKPSKALEYADTKKIKKVIFIGEDEIKKNKFKIKDMKTGKESLLTKKEILGL